MKFWTKVVHIYPLEYISKFGTKIKMNKGIRSRKNESQSSVYENFTNLIFLRVKKLKFWTKTGPIFHLKCNIIWCKNIDKLGNGIKKKRGKNLSVCENFTRFITFWVTKLKFWTKIARIFKLQNIGELEDGNNKTYSKINLFMKSLITWLSFQLRSWNFEPK